MDNELKCPICGEPTLVYYGNPRKDRLCAKHGKMAKDGVIVQCSDCGTWHNADQECECKKPAAKTTTADELTCIICGQPSNGKHFCPSCYHKYKDREIELHVRNCTEFMVTDEYCNKKYKCDDGRKVRSKSEKMISDFLFKYKIRAIYEKTVYYYTKTNETIELKPDFYLPDYDIYIEHNGLNTKSYKANKQRTQEMYKELNYNVVITTEEDLEDIEKKLKPILRLN